MNNKAVMPYDKTRAKSLYNELAFALSRTDKLALKEWGIHSSIRFVKIGGLRIKSLSQLAAAVGHITVSEFQGFIAAWRDGKVNAHLENRAEVARDKTVNLAQSGAKLIGGIGSALMDNPKQNAPKVISAFLGFYAGSGGVDGNGGIPDLDLLVGIDAHRSILTHSIIAGVVAEGMLLAAVDLAVLVQDNLPAYHDPFWDKLAKAAGPLKDSLVAGASAGIAYHLLVDAGIQPAAYHGLPFEMPIEAHQAVMGVNGLSEGNYAAKLRRSKSEDNPVYHFRKKGREKTAGQKTIETFGYGVERTATVGCGFIKSFLEGVKKGYNGKD